MGKLLVVLVPLVLTIFCVVDALSSREDDVRHVPRLWWVLAIVCLPVIGAIAWLFAGRPVAPPTVPPRPGASAPRSPRAGADFQRKVRERAEEQRRKAAEQKKREEGDYPSTGE